MSVNPDDFIITRKRKKYKFAVFANSALCFEAEEWPKNTQPTTLELGAGTGLFGVALAASEPSQTLVAVDVKADRLQTGAKKAEEEKLDNVTFLRARADQLPELLKPRSLERIWVTFPDPFPKKQRAKNRLTHPKFLELYTRLLGSDGALYFKTDARDLFEWSLEQLVEQGWLIKELSFDLHESDLPDSYKIQTTYERRYISEGLKINFAKAIPPQV